MLLNYVTCPINIKLYAFSFIFIFLVFIFMITYFGLKLFDFLLGLFILTGYYRGIKVNANILIINVDKCYSRKSLRDLCVKINKV